jgi:hypothetical protein
MSYAYVECNQCDEQFEYQFKGTIDICPHCRGIDTLEELEIEPTQGDMDEKDYLYEQWKGDRHE